MANQLSVGDSSTIEEIAASKIAAGTFAFENGLCKYYSRDVEAGERVSPNVRSIRVKIDKALATDVWEVGQEVLLDEANQNAVKAGGTRGGYCAVASANGDSQVELMLGE